MQYLATFFTHFGAIKYRRWLETKGVEAVTLPVPRRLSSSCGIGVKFTTSDDVLQLVNDDIHKIFILGDIETVIYTAEE